MHTAKVKSSKIMTVDSIPATIPAMLAPVVPAGSDSVGVVVLGVFEGFLSIDDVLDLSVVSTFAVLEGSDSKREVWVTLL